MTESLADGFDAVSFEQWSEAATKGDENVAMMSLLENGVEAKWLYTPDDELGPDPSGLPGQAPFTRGTRAGRHWQIRQVQTHPDRVKANKEILEDLNGGVTEITLLLGKDGISISTLDHLSEVLDGVYLDLAGVALEAGAAAPAAAGLLAALWRENGIAPDQALGSFRYDPLGTLARTGELPTSPEEALSVAGNLAAETARDWKHVRALGVDTAIYVEAGATAAWELGIAIATGVEYLRAATTAGLEPAEAAARIEFSLAVGPDQFLEMAKFRAIRRLWARVLEESGVAEEARHSATYGKTSARMISAVDPWVNMLRVTTAAFAAGTGGADGVTVTPFDRMIGQPGDLGRRIARNTQIILQDESSLGRIADPLAGSWYGEELTDELAQAGWARFREIEREGGALAALRSGLIATTLAGLADEREDDLKHRRRVMTGVNEFPWLGDDGTSPEKVDRSSVEVLEPDVTGETFSLPALNPRHDSTPFETMRNAARDHEEAGGDRPQIYLACMGSIASHVNYANWAKSFFEVAGVETVPSGALDGNEDQARTFKDGGFELAAVCAGRNQTPGDVADLVGKLREAGAEYIYMVNSTPELNDAAIDAGADELVRNGANLIEVLTATLGRLGVEVKS
jgi:methylmalonyl-CoA mutase